MIAEAHVTNRDEIRDACAKHLLTVDQATPQDLAKVASTMVSLIGITLRTDDRFEWIAGEKGWNWRLTEAAKKWLTTKEKPCRERNQKASDCSPSARAAAPAARSAPTVAGASASKSATGAGSKPSASTQKPSASPKTNRYAELPVEAIVLPSSSAPTMAIEEISPARARGFLALSKGNRVTRKRHIAWLVKQMTGTGWRVTHQTIAISVSGRLLDGHHRLEAIALSGVTVTMAVTYGWADDTWGVIDCGIVRGAADRLRLIDDPYWNNRAIQIISAIMRMELGNHGKMTNEDTLTMWDEVKDGIQMVSRHFPAPILGLTSSSMFAALTRYHQVDAAKAREFAEQLRTSNGEGNHPAIVLRNWLTGSRYISGGMQGQKSVYWNSVGCMKAHLRGQLLADVETAATWARP